MSKVPKDHRRKDPYRVPWGNVAGLTILSLWLLLNYIMVSAH